MHEFRINWIPFAVAMLASWMAVPAEAQIPRPEDFFADPSKMFEEMFGPEPKEQERALAEIEVSVQEERRVGTQAAQAFLTSLRSQGIRVTNRGGQVGYLQDLVKTIQPLMENADRYKKIEVYLARSPRADARSFPGGTLVFFEGMFERSENEAALIGVVGHELSHLDRGHQLRRVREWKLIQLRLSGQGRAFTPQQFMQTGMMFAKVWTRPFRPEDELKADRDGARWAYLAGYDPRELAKLFERLGGDEQGRVALPSFLQSHPAPANRRQVVIDAYDQLQLQRPAGRLYVGKENLRRRVARSRQEFEPPGE